MWLLQHLRRVMHVNVKCNIHLLLLAWKWMQIMAADAFNLQDNNDNSRLSGFVLLRSSIVKHILVS